MSYLIIFIAIGIIFFAFLFFLKEIKKESKSRKRLLINILLIIEAIVLIIGFHYIPNKIIKKYELLYWSFALLLIIPIIWLALKDLKENIFSIQKNAVEEVQNLIKEIKKDKLEKKEGTKN